MFNLNSHVKNLLKKYIKKFPNEINRYELLQMQLEENDDLSTRKNFKWHLTASAYILSNNKKQIAIIHNINLNKWLAPGWHWENWDDEIYNNAKREAIEETWIKDIELLSWHKDNNYIPIDIDTHYIPENTKKEEKEHFHHDFRYIFILNKLNINIKIQLEEVKWFKWIPIWEQWKNFSWNNVIKKISKII